MSNLSIHFDNTYARDLQGFYEPCQPEPARSPELLFFNRGLAEELKLGLDGQNADELKSIFSGNDLPAGAQPIAQAYSGHQFGYFSPRLGDGRALLIGEVVDRDGKRRDIAFKGSGRTPFSRSGDGKAAMGPMLREVLIGEAMHALGIPTTRALAVVATGETVFREQTLPGAILTRVAASHLRVGTFQFFAEHATLEQVRQLADYAIARHYPEVREAEDRYLTFLHAVAERQAELIAKWMHVGFVHGVMNTDNMGIPGETIDYGPCAFMEAYDPGAVFSSIDHGGRYAYKEQPHIAQWNLARLAETLLPLMPGSKDEVLEHATRLINDFPARYQQYWLAGLRAKLGLSGTVDNADHTDLTMGQNWLDMLHAQQVDFTLAWRRLADAAEGNEVPLRALFVGQPSLDGWLKHWRARCAAEDAAMLDTDKARAARMRRVNPWLIPRNHRVEEALTAASEHGNLVPFEQLLNALQYPFEENAALARYAEPAPAGFMSGFRTFCGT